MKYLIGNTVLNSDHIVSVEYTPPTSGIDDETGLPYSSRSIIEITTTAIERDCETGYEGKIEGVGSKSTIFTWRGTSADAFWEAYSKDAYAVVV